MLNFQMRFRNLQEDLDLIQKKYILRGIYMETKRVVFILDLIVL